MITEIDHIGIAVKDLKEALSTYSKTLGLESVGTEVIGEQKVIVGKIEIGGVMIELLQPTRPDGPIGKFIDRRGEGMHHIALRVEDIERCLREMKEKGVNLIDTEPRIGAGGSKIAFLHPKGMHGVLLELVER